MKVTLTPELEALVEERLKRGTHGSASEVVREGLRFFFAHEPRRPRPGFLVSTREELETKLLEGVEQLDRGERTPGESAFKRLKARANARNRNHG